MRVLVFGGTLFVSQAVAAEAVARGHDVVCAARGKSGRVPDGATLVPVDRDAHDGLSALVGERFDAVVDTSIMSHRWTADALAALVSNAGHWTFVSSISVYSDHSVPGQGTDAPVHEPRPVHATLADRDDDPDLYGAVKVASENTVRDAMTNRAFVVRPGLVTGPGDHTDRFGYWPARFARGGQVVVPDAQQQMQYIDVRDLAEWIVTAAEQRLAGTFDGIGAPAPLSELLAGIAGAVGGSGADAEMVPIAPEVLTEAEVAPWGGPRSLPLWLPPGYEGMGAHDAEPALAAGLRPRPLADAVAGALAHERALGLDRERKSGLTPAEEAQLLAPRA
ncbi:MAG: NAD-dependent epimerase/dehydratase family protein [Actinophytocola sp.]|nr:NAD-dependent epimerase/dehydratase family protein [Actinophytocola sp.]